MARLVFAEESRGSARLKTLKILAIPAGCFFLVAAIPLLMVMVAFGFGGDGPTNKVISAAVSPDGRLQAVIFTQTGYDGPFYNTEVSVIGAKQELPNDDGNVFVCSQGSAPRGSAETGPVVSVAWIGPRQLLVTYDDRSKVDLSRGSVRTGKGLFGREQVSISYGRNEPEPSQRSPFAGTWKGRCSWEGRMGTISFSVAQFGEVFDLKIDGAPHLGAETYFVLDDSGRDGLGKTRLVVHGNRIKGILLDNGGMAYSINVTRNGPTRWVAPDPCLEQACP